MKHEQKLSRRDILKLSTYGFLGLIGLTLPHFLMTDDGTDLKTLAEYGIKHVLPIEGPTPDQKDRFLKLAANRSRELIKCKRDIIGGSTYQIGSSMLYNICAATALLNENQFSPNSSFSFIDTADLKNNKNTYPKYSELAIGNNIQNEVWGIGVCLASTLLGRAMISHPDFKINEIHSHSTPIPRYTIQSLVGPHPELTYDISVAWNPDGTSYDLKTQYVGDKDEQLTIEIYDNFALRIDPHSVLQTNGINTSVPNNATAFSINNEKRAPMSFLVTANHDAVKRSKALTIEKTIR